MPDDFLNSVFQNCNELWGAHNAFDNAPEGARRAELFNLVMVATQKQSDLLHAAAMLDIDLTPFSAWLVVIQKAHLRAGQNGSLVDEHADDSWPSVHAVIQRLRYAAGAAIELAAAAPEPDEALRHKVLQNPDSCEGWPAIQIPGGEVQFQFPDAASLPPQQPAAPDVPDGNYSPTDIAKAIDPKADERKKNAVQKALKRLFDDNRLPDGAWLENSNPAKGQAKILYKLSVVRPFLVRFEPHAQG